MTATADLWAIGYGDMQRADEIREEIVRLGWDTHYLNLLDVVVVVRRGDGSFTFDRKPFPAVASILGCTAVGFLAGLDGGRAAPWRGGRRAGGRRGHRRCAHLGRDQ